MSNKKDDQIDRLLTAIHSRTDAGVSPDCLDAEALAAWMDHQLDGPALARAEAHAAGCARCQSMLASMARTADAGAEAHAGAAAPRSKFWRMLPWAAPLTAAATAAALYVAVRTVSVQPVKMVEAPASVRIETPAGQKDALPVPATIGGSGQKAEAGARARADQPAERAEASTAPAVVPAPRDEKAKLFAEAKAASPARAKPGSDLATRSPANTTPLPPVREIQPAAPKAPPPVASLPQAAAAPPTAAARSETARFADRAAAVGGTVFTAFIVIPTPDPAIRWRIVGGTVVQFSNDQGKTWTTQQTGPAVGLSAGAATSSTVCWIVGRAGTVLRSTDGRTWQRLAFPEPADLVRVDATSAEIATVTAADGRTFTTSDGGNTWGPSVP